MVNLRWKNEPPVEVEYVDGHENGAAHVEVAQEEVGAMDGDASAAVLRRPSLASLLTDAGIASDSQVREALEEGNRTGEKLGEVVVRRGWASEYQLAQVLAAQWGLTAVDPEPRSLDPLAVDRLETGIAAELGGLPVWFDGNHVVAAVAEPSEERFAALSERLGDVSFVVVPRGTLQRLLNDRVSTGNGASRAGSPVELLKVWPSHNDTDGSSNDADEAPSEDDDSHEQLEDQLDIEPASALDGTSPAEEPLPPETTAAAAGGPLTLADRLRSIEAEVRELEQALVDARRTIEAQDVELSTARATHENDLDTIRRLEADCAERSGRLEALREKIADLSVALDA